MAHIHNLEQLGEFVMDLLQLLQASGQQDKIIGALAGQFGLDQSQTGAVMGQVMGALKGGMQKQASQNGVKPLINAVMKGNHGQYMDEPTQLLSAETEGNAILGHLLGSKDVSRALAGKVEQDTGVSSSIVKKMLPILAMAAMGAISKNLKPANAGTQSSGNMSGAAGLLGTLGALAGNRGGQAGGMAGMIGSLLGAKGGANKAGLASIMGMLDQNNDGNPLDDIMKMVGK